jgi:hypothetical protein
MACSGDNAKTTIASPRNEKPAEVSRRVLVFVGALSCQRSRTLNQTMFLRFLSARTFTLTEAGFAG